MVVLGLGYVRYYIHFTIRVWEEILSHNRDGVSREGSIKVNIICTVQRIQAQLQYS